MIRRLTTSVLLVVALLIMPSLDAQEPKRAAAYPFAFRDVGKATGLLPHVGGIRGHGAAWGDVDGDGWPDLFVASFHDAGSKAGMFFRNEKGTFRLDDQASLRTSGMGSGALFADLTNDGRLDLYVSTCAIKGKTEVRKQPSYLLRNDGKGTFTDVTASSGATLPLYAGRGIAALDFDGDGRLDLATCERYYGAVQHGPALMRNLGSHRFRNDAGAVGLPAKLSGLGIAAADLNNDGWPDLVFTEGSGEHRVYLNDGAGKFREAPGTRDVLRWKGLGKDDTPAGVCIADVNRDGLLDLVIGHHFKRPWAAPAPVRLYLNRGVTNGVPRFEDVTEAAGLRPLAMKAPHVEVQDFDNDGWPDLFVSIVVYKDGRPCPVIYRNLGVRDGIPRFREDAMALTDFPTAQDKTIRSSGPFFAKLLKEKKIIYMAAGPSVDYDCDGRLDLFLASWWIEAPSLLLRNETPGGRWFDVRVEGRGGVNRMGIGARVNVYETGQLHRAASLLGSREIAAGYGYCSGQEAVAHFGLGDRRSVDVEVILPHGKGRLQRRGVTTNQRITLTP